MAPIEDGDCGAGAAGGGTSASSAAAAAAAAASPSSSSSSSGSASGGGSGGGGGGGGGISSGGCFSCGLGAGLVVTAVLNPWDRALFLSIVNQRAFLSAENWRDPYRGLAQTLAQRSISSGLYFPLEDRFSRALGSSVLGGQAAGVVMGILLNPFSFVKYQCWGSDTGRLFLTTARRVYMDAGPLVFLRGAGSSAVRDAIFGLCFAMRKTSWVQAQAGPDHSAASRFVVATLFAAVGTAASSPFNYVRSLAYAEKSWVPLESLRSKYVFTQRTLGDLIREAGQQPTRWSSTRFLSNRMRLGWGTARVAVGMAGTDQCYLACCRAMSS